MALTTEQDEYLTLLLQGLEPCSKDIYPNGRKFVTEQVERHDQYGTRMFMSPKQLAWLEALYKEHVGTLPDKGNSRPDDEDGGEQRDEREEDGFGDDDDSIPF